MNPAQDNQIHELVQPSELAETLTELNSDDVDVTRMSKIDLKTRLHYMEINSILAMDTLVSLGVLPTKCLGYTRQKKRLNVSLDGKGRQEMVEISVGKREHDAIKQGSGGFKNWLGIGNKQ